VKKKLMKKDKEKKYFNTKKIENWGQNFFGYLLEVLLPVFWY